MTDLNNFLSDIQNEISVLDDIYKGDYLKYRINNYLVNNDDINIKNFLTNILSKNIGNHVEKLKYMENNSDIVLITQYYEAKNEQRFKENAICLVNNLLNDNISKVVLLNEREYDLSIVLNSVDDKCKKKLKQVVIEDRLKFNDGFNYANTFLKNKIVIIANLDVFFDNSIEKCKNYDFNNLFLSLSRYDLVEDYKLDGNNQIRKFSYDGPQGNPVIDSADSWIFKAPIKTLKESKIMLGSNGCDTIINYIYKYKLNYNVVNAVNSIISIHYHLEQTRDNVTTNNFRSHSGELYNKNNNFNPENHEHLYLVQKSVELCNKIESFCSFATKNAYKDLYLLLKSLELYHADIPIFILCDEWTSNKIDKDNFNLNIHKRIELEVYCDMNRKIMEEKGLFKEFLLKKADVVDYAMEYYNNTLFIDGDIVILNKMDLLVDNTYDVGLSPHNIFEESENKFGKYNAGFMYVNNKDITQYWRQIVENYDGFVDQQALDYFEEKFKVYKFDDSYNFGWWRLFQCNNPQKRANLFTILDNKLYYEFKSLKCIHTHFYEQNDSSTIEFNKFIINKLNSINHPILNFIFNSEKDNLKTKDIQDLPLFIIPKQPRNDFWKHNNDTFRELLYMWRDFNLCNLKEENTKHVWYNRIGDILLYDRPTLEWLKNDSELNLTKILFGNPEIPESLKNISYNWIFWGRSPKMLYKVSKNILSYNQRRIESIFIGKIENHIQEEFRTKQNYDKFIQIYKMHKPDEKYVYNQKEYLELLKNSKFGLSLRGFGPKCNREIELMALGTVPIITQDVSMTYYDSPIENKHYFRINNADEIPNIIKNCSEETWTKMSTACIEWYNKNCSLQGSFNTTMNIINNEIINKIQKKNSNESNLPKNNNDDFKKKYENIYSLKNTKLFT